MNKGTFSLVRLRNSKFIKVVVVFFAVNLLFEIISPSVAYALTSGPSSPEFSSFEPVSTTDMVNDFTGDFVYNIPVLNIPGPDGGGYSMSLSYHSGVSSEEEASWVGYGWTLNPGAINRIKRGYADDFNGIDVESFNKTKPNWTLSSTFDMAFEVNSKDKKKKEDDKESPENKTKGFDKFLQYFSGHTGEDAELHGEVPEADYMNFGSLSFSKSVRFNNYSGFSIANGFGAGAKGMINLNLSQSGTNTTFGYSINPFAIFQHYRNKWVVNQVEKKTEAFVNGDIENAIEDWNNYEKAAGRSTTGRMGAISSYSSSYHNTSPISYSVAKFHGRSYNFRCSAETNPIGPVGGQIGIAGSMNMQVNIPLTNIKAYGYMYNQNVGTQIANENIETDFQLERASTFKKHDKYLGIPFNNADIFNVTGNGVIGGFRIHHNQIGNYYPGLFNSTQRIGQTGVEIGFLQTLQIGFDVGFGWAKTNSKPWDKPNIPAGFTEDSYQNQLFDESNTFMQFFNDKGGELTYSDNMDELVFAKVKGTYPIDHVSPDYTTISDQNQINTKNGQTSKIEYAYFNNADELINRQDNSWTDITVLKDQIVQIGITNQNGEKTVYGQPVLVKNEYDYSVGIVDENNKFKSDNGEQSFLVYQDLNINNPLDNKTIIGTKVQQPYSNTFLITQKTSYDYFDKNDNGIADKDDFGGWTKFRYKKKFENYRYRAPYTGLYYNRGLLYDLKDQMGSMSSGGKDVFYLKYIETKTHIAFFITNTTDVINDDDVEEYRTLIESSDPTMTDEKINAFLSKLKGSGQIRHDGLDAASIGADGMDPAAADEMAKGNHHLDKLEKIVLFSKSDFNKPISTTYFEYNYSLCRGIPNSDGVNPDELGKLTLKKVWTEGGGTASSKIAPYQFKYEYFDSYPANILSKYPEINPGDMLIENPFYKPELLDMWGCYQENGENRFERMIPWVSQQPGSNSFDPAAWHLKRIILPSGGEIHIQYEQKDYTHVQDKQAMAMVNLNGSMSTINVNGYTSDVGTIDGGDHKGNKYYLNTDYINVPSSEIEEYADVLSDYFIQKGNKLYFRMLFGFKAYPTLVGSGNLEGSEYITGYTTVNKVVYDSSVNGIYLVLGELNNNGEGKTDKTLPRWVAYEKFLTNSKFNMCLSNSGDYDDIDEHVFFTVHENGWDINDSGERDQIFDNAIKSHLVPGTLKLFSNWVGGDIRNEEKMEVCEDFDPHFSYFKLPVYNAKKGGGVRVKRLLSYNPGIDGESGQDAMVYGVEYLYQTKDGKSSGVAVNEPAQGREENALVGFLEKDYGQCGFNKLLNGRDSKQFEGPLGESLLPGASVVHERVVIKNIHNGKTTTGYQVNEYHTVRTFPSLEVKYSKIEKENDTYKRFKLSLPLGFFSLDMDKNWVTQGYLFKMNDMNGKIKSSTVYPGNYSLQNFSENSYTSKTVYNYSKVGESVKTLVYDPETNTFSKGQLSPGTEEDITMFNSEVEEKVNDLNFELDLNISLPLALSLGLGFGYSYSENQLSQHVTSKVVNQVSYLMAVSTETNGIKQITENLAFDKFTGEPVLTRTYDGYMKGKEEDYGNSKINTALEPSGHSGYYYGLSLPAHWIYKDLGPEYLNAANKNILTATAGNIVTYGENAIYSMIINSSLSEIVDPEFNNVVSASATVYKNKWFANNLNVESLKKEYNNNAVFPLEIDNTFYPYRTYVYKSEVENANAVGQAIYKSGLFNEVSMFSKWLMSSWGGSSELPDQIGTNWLSTSEVITYSPNGTPLAERNALDIFSAVKYGYEKLMPVIVAQNADYNSIDFIDYEYDVSFVPDANISNLKGHSGEKSLMLSSNPSQIILKDISLSQQMFKKGAYIKLWLNSSLSENPSDINFGLKNNSPQLKAKIGSETYPFEKVAQTGEWSLYVVKISGWDILSPGGIFSVGLDYNFIPGETVLIDDVCIYPVDASVSCYVYTNDLKPLVVFDSQHFGMFYEYNSTGQLTRKRIETERGIKTIEEQQYNVPLITR